MRIVVLDDYQQVAADFADWDGLGAEVESVPRPIRDDDDLVAVLTGAEAVVAVRERTPVTADRAARPQELRLLGSTGRVNAAIDADAACAQVIVVCGTVSCSSAPPQLTWVLILSVVRSVAV